MKRAFSSIEDVSEIIFCCDNGVLSCSLYFALFDLTDGSMRMRVCDGGLWRDDLTSSVDSH